MRSFLRLTAVTLLAMFFLVAGTPTASAHATRIAEDPVDKSTLTSGPPRVSATFNEQMQPAFAAMTVVGPDGNLWSTGDPLVEGAVISVAVRALGLPGTYTVNYRATSADGHVVSGSWSFDVTTPSTGEPVPPVAAPPSPPESDVPVWPFVAGATAVVAAGGIWAVRRRL